MAKSGNNWTVMVYLAGNNNLSEECVWSLTEMTKAFEPGTGTGSDERVSVFAQYDSPISNKRQPRAQIGAGHPKGASAGLAPHLGEGSAGLTSFLLKPANTEKITYEHVLSTFIRESIDLDPRPVDHYMVILSGHGSGTDGDFLKSGIPPRALTIPQLKIAFTDVQQRLREKGKGKIDILGMDSCLMSMVEVGYELRHYADILIGAEGFALNTGWPYREILTVLRTEDKEPEELAKRFVTEYIKYYDDYRVAGRSVDLAACKLKSCKTLADAVGELANLLQEKLEVVKANKGKKWDEVKNYDEFKNCEKVKNAVLLAHWEAQSYKDDQYTDLHDFCEVLKDKLDKLGYQEATKSVAGIREACGKVQEAVHDMVILTCYSGAAVQYSHGLSIYFPWSQVSDDYKKLKFAKATAKKDPNTGKADPKTGWFGFLNCYVEATRRLARPGRGKLATDTSIVELSSSDHRWAPPDDKWAPPDDKVLSTNIGSMKNPPIEYFECKDYSLALEALVAEEANAAKRGA